MAVRIVARDSLAQPEHIRGAEVRLEDRLELRPPQTGVADLHRLIEQAFLGGEHRAAAVDVDAAAFEHDIAISWPRPYREQSYFESRGRARGDAVVQFPIGVLGPCIEPELRDRERRGMVCSHEDGPEVAGPAAVGGEPDELDAADIDAPPLFEHPSGPALVGGRIDQDAHQLSGRERPRDLAVHPRDRGELAGPIAGVVGPADPRGVVRLPLGRHAEAEAGGGVLAEHYARSSRNRLAMPP